MTSSYEEVLYEITRPDHYDNTIFDFADNIDKIEGRFDTVKECVIFYIPEKYRCQEIELAIKLR